MLSPRQMLQIRSLAALQVRLGEAVACIHAGLGVTSCYFMKGVYAAIRLDRPVACSKSANISESVPHWPHTSSQLWKRRSRTSGGTQCVFWLLASRRSLIAVTRTNQLGVACTHSKTITWLTPGLCKHASAYAKYSESDLYNAQQSRTSMQGGKSTAHDSKICSLAPACKTIFCAR